MGSVVEYVSQHSADAGMRAFPDYVYLPNNLGHLQGYDRTGSTRAGLGTLRPARDGHPAAWQFCNPFFRECTDEELDFRIKGLVNRDDMPLDRLDRRRSLIEQFDDARQVIDASRSFDGYGSLQQRALDLVTSDQIRSALDIQRESASLRDRYGRHLFGQSVLMGRRMIEAGCRFVTVIWDAPDGYSWGLAQTQQRRARPPASKFDQSFSALLTDMEQRGLLDETLVVAVGEMGRTPKGNSAWGRGHWSHCFPAILAGAGIRGGITYGASDKDAAYPIDNSVSPEDLRQRFSTHLGSHRKFSYRILRASSYYH